jgi:hypothetical protein
MNGAKVSLLFAAILLALASGCASHPYAGSAATSVSGSAQSKKEPMTRKQGEFYNTETLAPGVGSALFPDPAW